MSTLTTDYGQIFTIETISAGYGKIDATHGHPEIHITRENDGLWYAAYVGSARLHNIENGWQVNGGHKTRAAAANWLLMGNC